MNRILVSAFVIGLIFAMAVETVDGQQPEGMNVTNEAVLFIYNANGDVDPCHEQGIGGVLLPSGTGFLSAFQ